MVDKKKKTTKTKQKQKQKQRQSQKQVVNIRIGDTKKKRATRRAKPKPKEPEPQPRYLPSPVMPFMSGFPANQKPVSITLNIPFQNPTGAVGMQPLGQEISQSAIPEMIPNVPTKVDNGTQITPTNPLLDFPALPMRRLSSDDDEAQEVFPEQPTRRKDKPIVYPLRPRDSPIRRPITEPEPEPELEIGDIVLEDLTSPVNVEERRRSAKRKAPERIDKQPITIKEREMNNMNLQELRDYAVSLGYSRTTVNTKSRAYILNMLEKRIEKQKARE